MTLAILKDDGTLIADADWNRMDDVMRGAHGHGVKVMPGRVVTLPYEPERCGYSELFPSQCGHCLGHRADWEPDLKRVYG